MGRRKDVNWGLPDNDSVGVDQASLAVLMDIRDELKALNRLLNCANAIEIPYILREIRGNTAKPARKKRKAR